jgi:hypothetical protein
MMRLHQPGSQPLDIPETIPNPAVPRTVPSPSPRPSEPIKVPAPQRAVRAVLMGGQHVSQEFPDRKTHCSLETNKPWERTCALVC